MTGSGDVAPWLAGVVSIEVLLLVGLLVWLSRDKGEWRRIRVGFFAEREHKGEGDEEAP